MIPGTSFRFIHPRGVAMVSEIDGVFVVEPMRFLYPNEAKREAQARNPKACQHRWKELV